MKKTVSFILVLCVCLSVAASAFAACSHPHHTIVDSFDCIWPHRTQVNGCSKNNTPHYHSITEYQRCYVYACVVCGGVFRYEYVTKSTVTHCESPCPPGGRIRCTNGMCA